MDTHTQDWEEFLKSKTEREISFLSFPFSLFPSVSLSLPKGSARVPAPPGAAGHRTGTQKNNPNQILNRSNPFFSSSKHVSESQNPNKKP
jgi:hypothetical protein